MNDVKSGRYAELDALRGIAALMVVFFHFTIYRWDYNSICKLGTTGVDLFFMISGFVIFMSLQRVSNSSEFIINRLARLFPTYWASVTFTFLFLRIYAYCMDQPFARETVVTYFANLTMVQKYIGYQNLDGPYWTLMTEMSFYILILFLFSFKLLRFIKIIGVIMCPIILILCWYYPKSEIDQDLIYGFPVLEFFPLFFAGILFFKIYTGEKQLVLNYSLIVICLISQLNLFNYSGRSFKFITYNEYQGMLLLFFILFILFVNNKLKFIVSKTTLFFGKISYALYLVHQCISLTFILPYFVDDLKMNFWLVVFCINLPVVVVVAAVITYKIEIPANRYVRGLVHSKKSGN